MPTLTLVLDSLPTLRDAACSDESGLLEAATLAQLAGVDSLRLGIGEELRPVRVTDVQDLRRITRRLELRMPPSQGLLKVALETRPNRVILASNERDGAGGGGALDLLTQASLVGPIVRSLEEAGIPSAVRVTPDLEPVKAAHSIGVPGVEFYTAASVDLPEPERAREMEGLRDAARLASKLHLDLGLGGGLGYESIPEVLAAAPDCQRVAVGRSVILRAVLVGLDQAVRDVRATLG